MGYHWEVLGLEPTGDVLAIKKAYAGLLKKNRPDEQPEAYQALRQAYEWALSEAEWRRQSPEEETDEGEPIAWPSESTHGEAVHPDAAPEAFEPFGDLSFESDRADALLNRWADRLLQCEAYQAEACWRELSHEIENLPLEEQTAASALFADFVLQHEALHTAVLASMARHFRWGRDYRDAERLGAYRLAQLRERLVQDAPTVLRDAQQVERATEVLRLSWVLEHQGKLAAWLYAALAGPHLGRLKARMDDTQRRGLGIPFLRWEAIGTAARIGAFVQLLTALICALAFVDLLAPPGKDLSNWVAAGSPMALGVWYLAWLLAGWLPSGDFVHSKLSAVSWRRTDIDRIIAINFLPLMLAGIARSASEFPALQAAYPVLGLVSAAVMVLTFFLLAWPEEKEERQIFFPMLGVFAFVLTGMTGMQDAGLVAAFVIAAGWVGLGGWVYQQAHDGVMRLYRNPWAPFQPKARWSWTLLVAASPVVLVVLMCLMVLALPVTLRVLARYMSPNTALLVIGLAVVFGTLPEQAEPAYAIPIAMALVAVALVGLQAVAEQASGRLFHRVPATFFQHDD